MDKVELVDANCGLQLWRKLTQEYEPKWKSRHLSRHQAILNFKFPDDVIAGFDQFEKELRQYHNKMFVEIREILGTKKYMNQESVINAVSKTMGGGKGGKGKKGGKSDSKGQITTKFAGECWVCGDQAINNRTAGTIRIRSRKPRLQRSRLRRTSR